MAKRILTKKDIEKYIVQMEDDSFNLSLPRFMEGLSVFIDPESIVSIHGHFSPIHNKRGTRIYFYDKSETLSENDISHVNIYLPVKKVKALARRLKRKNKIKKIKIKEEDKILSRSEILEID